MVSVWLWRCALKTGLLSAFTSREVLTTSTGNDEHSRRSTRLFWTDQSSDTNTYYINDSTACNVTIFANAIHSNINVIHMFHHRHSSRTVISNCHSSHTVDHLIVYKQFLECLQSFTDEGISESCRNVWTKKNSLASVNFPIARMNDLLSHSGLFKNN